MPDDVNGYYNRGATNYMLEKYDEALNDYETAYNIDQSDTTLLFHICDCNYELYGFEKGIQCFEQLKDMGISEYEILLHKAFISLDSKKYESALVYYHKIFQSRPNNNEAVLGTIVANYNLGNKKETNKLIKRFFHNNVKFNKISEFTTFLESEEIYLSEEIENELVTILKIRNNTTQQ